MMFKIMPNINLFCLMIIFLFSTVFSQTDDQYPPALIERYLDNYNNYTSFDIFQKQGEEEQDYELRIYTAITNVIEHLEEDIFRLFYANAEKRKTMVDYFRQSAFDNTGIEFNIVNYYDAIQLEGIVFLKNAYELLVFLQHKYDEIKEGLTYIQIPEQEIFDKQVQIKILQGICLFYMTGTNNLKKSLAQFNFLLGQNDSRVIFANTSASQERVFKYIIAIYNVLLNKSSNLTNIEIDKYRASLLYYKWKLVELLNQENTSLKDYKLMRLTKNYYTYMPIKSGIFEEKYKPYVIKLYELAKDNKTLEKKLILKFGENIFSYRQINAGTADNKNQSISEE